VVFGIPVSVGSWVTGLLGYWVTGLLGYWVTGLLGYPVFQCWVALGCCAGVVFGMSCPESSLSAGDESGEGAIGSGLSRAAGASPVPWGSHGSGSALAAATTRLPKGFSVCFYDRGSGETVACPRDYEVETIGRSHYLFRKGSTAYSVDLEEGTCTCQDFLIRRSGRAGATCKHLRLARALSRRATGGVDLVAD
jgi:hypothetical protein